MRNYEQFEAAVFEAADRKRKIKKRRKRIIFSTCMCFCICVTVASIGFKYLPESKPQAPAIQDKNTQNIQTPEAKPEAEQEINLNKGEVSNKAEYNNHSSEQNVEDADLNGSTSNALSNGAPPVDFFTPDYELTKQIYHLITGKENNYRFISCAYYEREGVHRFSVYYHEGYDNFVIKQNTVYIDNTSFEISTQNLEKLLEIVKE